MKSGGADSGVGRRIARLRPLRRVHTMQLGFVLTVGWWLQVRRKACLLFAVKTRKAHLICPRSLLVLLGELVTRRIWTSQRGNVALWEVSLGYWVSSIVGQATAADYQGTCRLAEGDKGDSWRPHTHGFTARSGGSWRERSTFNSVVCCRRTLSAKRYFLEGDTFSSLPNRAPVRTSRVLYVCHGSEFKAARS